MRGTFGFLGWGWIAIAVVASGAPLFVFFNDPFLFVFFNDLFFGFGHFAVTVLFITPALLCFVGWWRLSLLWFIAGSIMAIGILAIHDFGVIPFMVIGGPIAFGTALAVGIVFELWRWRKSGTATATEPQTRSRLLMLRVAVAIFLIVLIGGSFTLIQIQKARRYEEYKRQYPGELPREQPKP